MQIQLQAVALTRSAPTLVPRATPASSDASPSKDIDPPNNPVSEETTIHPDLP